MDKRFVSAYSKSTGKKQRVPRHFIGHPVLGNNLELAPSARVAEAAALEAERGEPSESWLRGDLDKFAEDLGLDTTKLPNKGEVVAAIEKSLAEANTQNADGTPPSDETPATGDTEEE